MSDIVISVDPAEYGLEAVYMACYTFLNRYSVSIGKDTGKGIPVFLKAQNALSDEEALKIREDFQNELVENAIRLKIAASNQKIREYIIARALLQDSSPEIQDVPQVEEKPAMDDELEKEIQKLLEDVDNAETAENPAETTKEKQ